MASHHEGSPNIVKEAMCTPLLPRVSTRSGETSPWLFGGSAGHYLAGFDAAELAVKIGEAARYRKEFAFTEGRDRTSTAGT
ncbi:MAG: hypothetical protein MZV63_47100 [Marinilabiliales bacterium]|nr:hypothetical protein [Marinilabiliales bacterium]